MSVTDEDALRGRFDLEFGQGGTFPLVGAAPADEVIRRGRPIRTRRRAGAAGALAVLAAVAVIVPGLWPVAGPTAPPASSGRHEVGVDRLGPTAENGVIASGSIDGQNWTVTVLPANMQLPGNSLCFALDAGLPVDDGTTVLCSPTMQPGVPVDFDTQPEQSYSVGSANDYPWFAVGVVRSDVAKVVVVLADSEVLTLRPIAYQGTSVVVFGAPNGVGVAETGAYDASGAVLGDLMPYNQSDGYPQLLSWYQPGQAPTLMPATAQIGSGVKSDGQHWTVAADLGPFGVCFPSSWLIAGDPPCSPIAQPGSADFVLYGLSSAGAVFEFGGSNAHLDHAVVTFSDGESQTLKAVDVEGRAFAAFLYPVAKDGSRVPIQSVISYDSSGKKLAEQENSTQIYY